MPEQPQYQIVIKKDAQKVLDNMPMKIRNQVDGKIAALAKAPRDGSVKMEGLIDTYRIRQGSYRVIYRVEDELLIVTVLKVGARGGVYKGS